MTNLNEYNEKTKRVIHLMVTSLCLRNCPHCCNKQYDLNDIPYVTDEELKQCEVLCLTGGEPFAFTNPCMIADYYKAEYPNIKKVYVYANASEFAGYLARGNNLFSINGVNVSIKSMNDLNSFTSIIKNGWVNMLKENRLYVFDNLLPNELGNFQVLFRDWQHDFKPADDSIFRKV